MKFIGSGEFTKAYKKGQKVYLSSTCPAKEAMALDMFPNSNLFPKVEFYDKMGDDRFKYVMNYYPDMNKRGVLNKLNPYYKNFYRELRQASHEYSVEQLYLDKDERAYKVFVKVMNKMKGVKKYHKDALIAAYFAIMNITDDFKIHFEMPSRNLATSKGRLILIDCFFVR